MWKGKEKAPIIEFIVVTYLLAATTAVINYSLEKYSVLMTEKGISTWQYLIYAIVGICFSTPGPMIAVYIVLKRHHNITGVKEFCKRILAMDNKKRAFGVWAIFAFCALIAAICFGERNEFPWYRMALALPLMIIGGGVEEVGWRGFLQPQLERTFSFPIAVLLTAMTWIPWHTDVFIFPSGGHYGDSVPGFILWLLVWSFVAATIYKVTKCVFACVMYHAFINSIGALYDWNKLFDAFPNKIGMYVYFAVTVAIAIVLLWIRRLRTEN